MAGPGRSRPGDPELSYGRRTALLYEGFMALVTLGGYRSLVSREAARLRPRPGDRAVDICCGTGLLTRALARRIGPKGTVVGIDSSEAMLDVARGNRPTRRTGGAVVSFVLADAARLPLDSESADLATMFLGLHEITPAGRLPALREVARVLRPGGRGLIFDVSSSIPRLMRRPARAVLTAMEGDDAWSITDPGVIALLRQAGLEPVERRPAFGGIFELVEFSRPLRTASPPSPAV